MSPSTDSVKLLIIGEISREEMQPIVSHLQARMASHDTIITRSILEACRSLKSVRMIPDLIVLLQSEPDEYSESDINALFGISPLSRIIVVCGEWCESISRTRSAWPIALQVRVSLAINRINRECELLKNQSSFPPIPWTASREEVFEFDTSLDASESTDWIEGCRTEKCSRCPTLAVISPDADYRSYLCDAIATKKNAVMSLSSSELSPEHENQLMHADSLQDSDLVLIVDVDPWTRDLRERLNNMRKLFRNATLIAVANSLSTQLKREIESLGINTLLPKFANLAILHKELDEPKLQEHAP